MAIDYKIGDKLYLPVTVINGASQLYPIKVEFFCDIDTVDNAAIANKPGLLLTEEEIYANRRTADTIEHLTDMMDYGRQKYDEIEELKSRNAELEALLKEVTATRDEAIRQNNELITKNNELEDANRSLTKACSEWQTAAQAHFKTTEKLREENKKLKADCNEWKDTANERLNAVQTLSAERNKVMAGVDELKNTLVDRTKDVQHLTEENANLKAWYEEANKTASEAAEANDELKAKIAELKAERDKFAKTAKDKADLAREAIDHLQEENNKLKQELKDAEASYNVVADTSIKRKNRVTTMEEVIVALVEKIRRLEGDKK